MTVTVIVPCFNHAKYIDECLYSIYAQTVNPIEIIVINDGSTDNFDAVIEKHLSKIHMVNQKNQGLAKSRNLGFELAQGDYILPIDADDFIDPSFISNALRVIATNKVAIAYPDIKKFGDEVGVFRHPPYSFDKLKQENYMVSCSLIVKSAWIAAKKANGYGYDPVISKLGGYEDHLFYLECGALGYYGAPIKKVLLNYRRTNQSMLNRARENFVKIRKYMVEKMKLLYDIEISMHYENQEP
jgi:glycosyltransferase involved in cell wall biosynthesis